MGTDKLFGEDLMKQIKDIKNQTWQFNKFNAGHSSGNSSYRSGSSYQKSGNRYSKGQGRHLNKQSYRCFKLSKYKKSQGRKQERNQRFR